MKPETYSLHKIDRERHFSFSPDEYSRFKFGDGEVARRFGEALCRGFIRDYLAHSPLDRQLVVLSSPYSFIPTATFALKNHFVSQLNRWLADHSLPVVQEAKVHRTVTYKEDYGELSAEERINLISRDSFSIDREFLEGKTLLFLDDIRITGSHERMILDMIRTYRLENPVVLLYFAELVNRSIHPNIENYLNYFSIKSIFDLAPLVRSPRFMINTRIVKYILNYDFTSFRIFIDSQGVEFVNTLYDMAIGNGYHGIEAYERNLNYIKANLISEPVKRIQYGN